MSKLLAFLQRLAHNRLARLLFSGLILAATGSLLVWLVYRQRAILFSGTWQFHPLYFLASMLVFGITLGGAALMWGWVMHSLGARLPLRRHVKYYLISTVGKRLPGSVWYIAGRAYWYKTEGVEMRLTSLGSGIEYAVMALSGGLCGLIFSFNLFSRFGVSPWILVVLLALCLALLHPRVLARLFHWLKVDIETIPFRTVAGWLLCYCGVWILGGISLFLMIGAVYPLPWQQVGYVTGCYVLVGLLSLSLAFIPATLGVSEVSVSLLLAPVMPSALAVIAALLSRLGQTLFEILLAGGLYGLHQLKKDH